MSMKRSALKSVAENVATEQLAARVEQSSRNMNKFLGWNVQARAAPSRKMDEVLYAAIRDRKKKNFISNFAIRDSLLLSEAGTKQASQISERRLRSCLIFCTKEGYK